MFSFLSGRVVTPRSRSSRGGVMWTCVNEESSSRVSGSFVNSEGGGQLVRIYGLSSVV